MNCPKHIKVGLVLRLAGGQSYIFRQSFVGQSYSKWLDFKIEAPKRDATIREAPKRDATIYTRGQQKRLMYNLEAGSFQKFRAGLVSRPDLS